MDQNVKLMDVLHFGAAEMFKNGGPDRFVQNIEIMIAFMGTHGIAQIANLVNFFSALFS